MTPSTNYLFAQNECRQALQTAKCWGCKNTKKHLATPGFRKGIPGPASLKNVEGKARRRRQYVSTARKPQRRHRHFLRLASLARHFFAL